MVGEVGKAAGGLVDALKTQPLVLALVVMNFALIGFVYYQNASFTSQRQENVRLFLDVQKEVQKLLSQCIVPPPPEQQRRSELFLKKVEPVPFLKPGAIELKKKE